MFTIPNECSGLPSPLSLQSYTDICAPVESLRQLIRKMPVSFLRGAMMATFEYGNPEQMKNSVSWTPANVQRWNIETLSNSDGRWMLRLGGSLGMCLFSCLKLANFGTCIFQRSSFAETSAQCWETPRDHGGSWSGQGREAAETYTGGRLETQSGKEKSRYRGAELAFSIGMYRDSTLDCTALCFILVYYNSL